METSKKRSPLGYVGLYVVGIIVGAANVIPGVSGGTMAFILGIYEELLDAIRRFASKDALKMFCPGKFKATARTLPWGFMSVLLLGVVSASLLLAPPIKWMLHYRLSFILAFFFGLVLASIITVMMRLSKFHWTLIPALAVGTAAGWLVVGLDAIQSPPEAPWYLIVCGAVAICAMILPGISGSFILMLMGRYENVLAAIEGVVHGENFGENLLTLILFVIGVVLGLASFARLLSWMFKRWRDLTIAVLAGFMVGSLRKIWPWKFGDVNSDNILPQVDDERFWIAVVLAVVGFALVIAIEFAARRFEKRAAAVEN